MAAVECHPYLVDLHQTGRFVDGYFHDLGRIAEAHCGTDGAAPVLATLRFRWASERSLDGDGALIDQRCSYDFGEGQYRLAAAAHAKSLIDAFDIFRTRFKLACSGGNEQRFQLSGGVDRRVANHERDARRIGSVVFGGDGSVGGNDADPVE